MEIAGTFWNIVKSPVVDAFKLAQTILEDDIKQELQLLEDCQSIDTTPPNYMDRWGILFQMKTDGSEEYKDRITAVYYAATTGTSRSILSQLLQSFGGELITWEEASNVVDVLRIPPELLPTSVKGPLQFANKLVPIIRKDGYSTFEINGAELDISAFFASLENQPQGDIINPFTWIADILKYNSTVCLLNNTLDKEQERLLRLITPPNELVLFAARRDDARNLSRNTKQQ